MLIIHVSQTIVAGAPVAIARGLREFSEHESYAISNDGLRWRPDFHPIRDRERVKDLLSRADVLHCHGNFLVEGPGSLSPLVRYINKRAKFVYQAHSFREECPIGKGPDEKRYKCLVIAQGWTRYWPKHWTKVRNVIFIDDEELMPIPWEKRKKAVSFTPSNRFCKEDKYGPICRPEKSNPKGWYVTIEKMRGAPFFFIEDKPYKECLHLKRNAWVGIDEVVTPMFHRSGLEYLSQGVTCIERMDKHTIGDVLRSTGAAESPFIPCDDIKELRPTVDALLRDEKTARNLGEMSREWMEKYWRPQDVIAEYVKIYEQL